MLRSSYLAVLAAAMLLTSSGMAGASVPEVKYAAQPQVAFKPTGMSGLSASNDMLSGRSPIVRNTPETFCTAAEADNDYTREIVVGAGSTALSIIGGALGSIFGGPGAGTIAGSAAGAGLGAALSGYIYDRLKKP